MTAPIGVGYYGRAVSVADKLPIYLFHLRPDAALECHRRNPNAFIVGRFDSGEDSTQARFDLPPSTAAAAFYHGQIEPAISRYPGVFSAALGINEAWPSVDGLQWRAAFELALCRLVQARGLRYIWGGISTGCLEAADVVLFADVWREAWAVNYHAYLAPGRTSIQQETDPWHVWRPFEKWLPELRRLGIALRLFVGELGPFAPDVRGDDLARCQVGIHRAIRARAATEGVEYVGAAAYGAGLDFGAQDDWELENSVGIFAAANTADGAVNQQGGQAPMALRDQYPQAFAEWEAAGGIENNFRAHLIGIGAIQPTKDDLQTLASNAESSIQQLKNAVNKLPFA